MFSLGLLFGKMGIVRFLDWFARTAGGSVWQQHACSCRLLLLRLPTEALAESLCFPGCGSEFVPWQGKS